MKSKCYYNVRIKIASDANGKVKWTPELYLVNATSVTDAEAIMVKDLTQNSPGVEFEIVAVSETKILNVLNA